MKLTQNDILKLIFLNHNECSSVWRNFQPNLSNRVWVFRGVIHYESRRVKPCEYEFPKKSPLSEFV
jgi:hypothetical protein